MDTLTSVLTSTMRMTTPLLLASLGLVISERSGMMQVTAEGLMVLGAFCGYVAVTVFGASIFVATLFAMLICMIASLIFSVTTISMPCQQVIVGTAMNMFIPGLCLFLYRSIYISGEIKVAAFDTAAAIAIPGLSSIPVIGNAVFNQNMYTYFSYIMVFVVWFILYRTSLGNKIISAGEHPMALVDDAVRNFGHAVNIGFTGAVVAAFDRIVEQPVDRIVVVAVVLGRIDTALRRDRMRTARRVLDAENLHVVSQFAERSGCGGTAQARTYDDNIQFAFVGRAYYLDRRLVVAPLLREFPGGYF